MANDFDLAGYQYKADEFCASCTVVEVCEDYLIDLYKIENWSYEQEIRNVARFLSFDIEDENTYDSDDFPKPLLHHHVAGEDRQCSRCHVNLEEGDE